MRPRRAPRASDRQWGAKSPENAGTKATPPLSFTFAARVSEFGRKSISNDEKYGKERTDFVGRVDDAEVVTQPANGKACNSNGSLGDSCEVLGGS